MSEVLLYCPGCNVKFKPKERDPDRGHKCPRCGQPLKPHSQESDTLAGGTLDTAGALKANDEADPLVGKELVQYRIVAKLGQGGMGVVYKAKHLKLDRVVALKVLPPWFAARDPAAVERFSREARAAAALDHPNVVTIHNVGEEGGQHFIEMELVDGESLEQRLKREGKLKVEVATKIVREAARGLAAAHARKIVHRDIKPANIMLSKQGRVKVMDFGLAKDVAADGGLTASGEVHGTPYYMSPEQCEAKDLDGRSDLYSLGATYYHLLAGEVPYKGDSALAIMYQHLNSPPPDVREQRDDVPDEVHAVIAKAMAIDVNSRYQTADEMIEDLKGALAALRSGSQKAKQTCEPTPAEPAPEATPAGLSDVVDMDEERDHHLHTLRVEKRLKEVEGFLGQWQKLAKLVITSRRSPKVSEKASRSFADARDQIAKNYESVLRRLGDAVTPGNRVVSACRTGATLESIIGLSDEEYDNFVKHLDGGAKLLHQYLDFLEDGRQDLLKRSVFYFYWDKYMHNKVAGTVVLAAAVALACVIGWKVAAHWPKGEKTPTTEVTESTEKTEPPQSALRTPQSAIPSASSVVDPASGQPKSFNNPTDGSEMIHVPAGTFKMGGQTRLESGVVHDVHVDAFYISKHEITNRQWKKFVDANPEWRKGKVKSELANDNYLEHWENNTYPGDKADHPVVWVSWFAAKAYCEWAGGRLGTEAEWEKAARGTDGRVYPWGREWDRSKCNSACFWAKKDIPDQNALRKWRAAEGKGLKTGTMKVGSFPAGASPYGALDMAGNVREWTSSMHKDYPYDAQDGREDPSDAGFGRVVRGGAWHMTAGLCRAARRSGSAPTYCLHVIGLRLCGGGGGWRVPARGPKAAEAARPSALSAQSAKSAVQLPPGLSDRFMLPDSDKDQHGNAVVIRNGSRVDPATGYPYEVWLKEPRMELVLIPAGEFMMGSSEEEIQRRNERYKKEVERSIRRKKYKKEVEKTPELSTHEGPRHRVRITKPFYLAKYETTVGQFRWFVEKTDYRMDGEKRGGATVYVDRKWQQKSDASWRNPYFEQGDTNPVVCVSWDDASAFCRALTESKGGQFTLPTDAQWEYACRAGSEGQYCYGDDPKAKELEDYAWFSRNSGMKTHPVGEKRANEWRVYDMHGNVSEWCLDGKRSYSSSSQTDPRGPKGRSRVLRGDSWRNRGRELRSARRHASGPTHALNIRGFRVVVELRFDAKREPSAPVTETRTLPVPSASGTPKTSKAKLPPGFEKTFEIPAADKDPHANPVVVRNGSRFDPKTGWPYEIWLKEPRMEFVLIPAGEFLMGSSAEEIQRLNEKYKRDAKNNAREGPRHRVRITKPFYLAKYETTVGQFRWFVDKADYRTVAEKRGGARVPADGKMQQKSDASWRNPYFEQGDGHPVVCVGWNDASAFCKALSKSKAGQFTLPTEAQWEYACRAGSEGQFCYGDDPEAKQLAEYAWFKRNSGKKTHPVGGKRGNEWRVYDMHGNVWEWCLDGRRAYSGPPQTDPRGSQGSYHVLRGGSWDSNVTCLRSGFRLSYGPTSAIRNQGFRVVVELRFDTKGEPSAPVTETRTSTPETPKAKLPPGFEKAFEIPAADKDQHANPVVVRNGSRFDPKTGWPYEVWLKEPRMEFVLIPAGEFMMGSGLSPKEIERKSGAEAAQFQRRMRLHPQHRVRISRPFYSEICT